MVIFPDCPREKNREILFIIKLQNRAKAATRTFRQDLRQVNKEAVAASKGVDRVGQSAKKSATQVQRANRVFQQTGTTLQRLRTFLRLIRTGQHQAPVRSWTATGA